MSLNYIKFFLKRIVHFKLYKIKHYIVSLPRYRRRHRFYNYIDCLHKNGNEYGTVTVSEGMSFVFKREDHELPMHMYISDAAYPKGTIDYFFKKCNSISENREDAILLEIGANIGTTTVYCRKKYVNRIVAFEPDLENRNLLTANLLLNDCIDGVKVEAFGVSDKETKKRMIINSQNRGNCHIESIGETSGKNEDYEEIETISIDNYLSTNGISQYKIKCAWIDVEGHEPYVIAGMKKLLKNNPIPLLMEFCRTRYSKEEFEMMCCILMETYHRFIAIIGTPEGMIQNVKKYEIDDLDHLYSYDDGIEFYDLLFY